MKKIFLLAGVVFATFACSTDEETRSDFELNTSPKLVGFENGSQSASFFTDQGQVNQDFILNFLGGGNGRVSDTDIFVNYTVSYPDTPVLPTDVTPAVEGTEFNFAETTGKIKIPAGTTFGVYPLKINTANLDRFKKTRIIITLTSASNGVAISKNHDTLLLNFVGCESMLAGTNYSLNVERNDGAIRNFTNETISTLSTNVFRTKSTALYLPSSLPAANPNSYGFDFEDICGDINLLKGQILARVYGNKVYGTGFYNGNDGKVVNNNNFQIRYAVSFTAGDSEYFARYTRP